MSFEQSVKAFHAMSGTSTVARNSAILPPSKAMTIRKTITLRTLRKWPDMAISIEIHYGEGKSPGFSRFCFGARLLGFGWLRLDAHLGNGSTGVFGHTINAVRLITGRAIAIRRGTSFSDQHLDALDGHFLELAVVANVTFPGRRIGHVDQR